MLKGPIIRTRIPIWDLMMKNVYNLNTYNLSTQDFKLNVIYADDTSGADYNFLPVNDIPVFADGNPLLRVLGLDRVNRQQEAKPDGVFDALEDITIQSQQARIIFPVLEPFTISCASNSAPGKTSQIITPTTPCTTARNGWHNRM
jgi:cell surface protein SprA